MKLKFNNLTLPRLSNNGRKGLSHLLEVSEFLAKWDHACRSVRKICSKTEAVSSPPWGEKLFRFQIGALCVGDWPELSWLAAFCQHRRPVYWFTLTITLTTVSQVKGRVGSWRFATEKRICRPCRIASPVFVWLPLYVQISCMRRYVQFTFRTNACCLRCYILWTLGIVLRYNGCVMFKTPP